jgi:hypothetical protein
VQDHPDRCDVGGAESGPIAVERGGFASPAYFERFGVPKTLHDLDEHRMAGLLWPDTSEIAPLVFCTALAIGLAPVRSP